MPLLAAAGLAIAALADGKENNFPLGTVVYTGSVYNQFLNVGFKREWRTLKQATVKLTNDVLQVYRNDPK